MKKLLRFIDVILGLSNPTIEDRIEKIAYAVLLPMLLIGFGLNSILASHCYFIGRRGLIELHGISGLVAGIAYLFLGLLAHVYSGWRGHPVLGGVADATAGLLAVLTLIALAGVMFSVLI